MTATSPAPAEFPSELLSGVAARDKIVTADEAVALIRDGDTVFAEGCGGQCFAAELTLALEARFLQTGTPRDLTLAFTIAQGNRQGDGFDRLCHDGLFKRAI
jgi:propionate CoA-transferase